MHPSDRSSFSAHPGLPEGTLPIDAPEQVRFTFVLADIGSRTYAYIVDLLIRILLFCACLIFVIILQLDILSLSTLGKVLLALTLFGLQFAYMAVFEALWNGQTPGKRFVGLRVVRDGGYPVGILAVTIRNLMRIVDSAPVFYGIGAPLVFLTRHHKRIGDFIAGTVVVKERSYDLAAYESRRRPRGAQAGSLLAPEASPWSSTLAALARDPDGLELVVAFLARRGALQPQHRIRLRWKILDAILARQPQPELTTAAVRSSVTPTQIEPFLEALRDRWT